MSTEVKPTDWDEEDNRWEPTPSGGGSGLPSYTSADKGKVLTIGEGEGSETTVIVPEQTAEFIAFGVNARAPITGVSFEGLSAGDSASVIVNGNTYAAEYGEVQRGVGVFYVSTEYSFSIYYDDRSSQYLFDDSNASSAGDTIAISATASVPSVEPKWEEASGGAFIINVSGTPGSALTPDKTYPELAEAVSGGAIPVVLLGGGSLVLEYSGKNGNVYKFERLSANTSGAAIEGFSCFLGEYDQGGFTVSSYSASL